MRNFVIGCIVLSAMAGTSCNEYSKPPEPSQQDATRQKTDVGSKTHGPLQEVAVDLGGGVKMELVVIPAGEFLMGSPDSDKEAFDWEKPQHRVRITKPFYLGKYLVTQEQWEAVMGNNPSDFKGPKNPVEQVLWDDCQQFLGKLNAKSAAGAGKFQLPTEAQWEYACRAGSKTRYCFGDDEKQLGEYAWYGKNSDGKTHPVGEKKPNAWGLYDMHGNVWEWCQDWWKDGYYKESPVDDPTGPLKGSYRVLRGGSWSLPARYRRSGVPPLRRARVPFRRLPGLACLPSSGGQAERASNTNPLTCCEHVQREPTAPPVAVEQDCARSTARWQDFNWVACSARFWSVACGATRSLVPGA